MSAAMTYDSLVTTIKRWLERPNDASLATEIPTFIMLAETRLATELKTLGSNQVVTSTMVTGDPTIAKPEFWRENISFQITLANGRRKTLFLRSVEYCRNYWPDESVNDEPRFYADYNFANFLIAPTPSANYAFELAYYARLQPLDSSHQTNWYTDNAPLAILYATMYEAQLWLKNYAQATEWLGRYDRIIAGLTNEDQRRGNDRAEAKK